MLYSADHEKLYISDRGTLVIRSYLKLSVNGKVDLNRFGIIKEIRIYIVSALNSNTILPFEHTKHGGHR